MEQIVLDILTMIQWMSYSHLLVIGALLMLTGIMFWHIRKHP